jgi:hypothetical protein
MTQNKRAADGGPLNVVLLIVSMVVLLGLRWLGLKSGFALLSYEALI